MKDIENNMDVQDFVNCFYEKVQKDDLLGPIFASKIQADQWQNHLSKMYNFWESVLFHKANYKGNPFLKHIDLPIHQHHFSRWIDLFEQTIDESFQGERALDAKKRASNIARLFSFKINQIQNMANSQL